MKWRSHAINDKLKKRNRTFSLNFRGKKESFFFLANRLSNTPFNSNFFLYFCHFLPFTHLLIFWHQNFRKRIRSFPFDSFVCRRKKKYPRIRTNGWSWRQKATDRIVNIKCVTSLCTHLYTRSFFIYKLGWIAFRINELATREQ